MKKFKSKHVTMQDVIDEFRGVLKFEAGQIKGHAFECAFRAHGKRVYIVRRRDGVLFANVNGGVAVVGSTLSVFRGAVMQAFRHA